MEKLLKSRNFQVISNIIASVVLAVSIIICFLVITSMRSSTGMPNLFGRSYLAVKSESMSPTFNKGDLIIIKLLNDTQRNDYDAQLFEVDDVITFQTSDDDGNKYINTHRIVEVETGTKTKYITKGDSVDTNDRKKVYNINIIGSYTGKKYTGLGKVFEFIKSSEGVLFCVVIPAAIVILWQVYITVYSYLKKKNELLAAMEAGAKNDGNNAKSLKHEKTQNVTEDNSDQASITLTPQQFALMQAQMMQAQMAAMQMQNAGAKPPTAEEERERIIREYNELQKAEETKKKQIIDEYLAQQAAAAEADKKKAADEEEKIKQIISEYLSQQKKSEDDNN